MLHFKLKLVQNLLSKFQKTYFCCFGPFSVFRKRFWKICQNLPIFFRWNFCFENLWFSMQKTGSERSSSCWHDFLGQNRALIEVSCHISKFYLVKISTRGKTRVFFRWTRFSPKPGFENSPGLAHPYTKI